MNFMQFNDEQSRVLVNLRQHYEVWCEAERGLRLTGDSYLVWRRRGETDYLYTADTRGQGSSLGKRSPETEALYEERQALTRRVKESTASLQLSARLYRALRMGEISSPAAAVLREADVRGMLGTSLLVVGTNAMAAYEAEAAVRFAIGMDATDDFDLAWAGQSTSLAVKGESSQPQTLFGLLKDLDSTYTINTERSFQARNSKAFEVELLLAPSMVKVFPANEKMSPIPLPEQEWLLLGTPVNQVVAARDFSAARIIAPDPRWMALHKLWLGDQKKRARTKVGKDKRQGAALLQVTSTHMPHYPLDDAFRDQLPIELRPYFDRFRLANKPSI